VCVCVCVRCTLTEVFLNLIGVFFTLTEVFPHFFLSCKANAKVKLAKTFVVFVVPCIVLCKCVLPPGDDATAVNKYIV
jgi:hypothetical protein